MSAFQNNRLCPVDSCRRQFVQSNKRGTPNCICRGIELPVLERLPNPVPLEDKLQRKLHVSRRPRAADRAEVRGAERHAERVEIGAIG